jgi:hypothetical protein
MNIHVQFGFNNICSFIGPYGEHVSKHFFPETTRTIETKLPRNDHWKVLYKASFFMPEKKIFEISADQSILLALAAMLNIRLERKTEINIGSYGKMFKCLLLRNYKYD